MSLLSFIVPENCSREELENALKGIGFSDELGVTISSKKKCFGLIKNRDLYVSLWLHDFLTDEADWNAEVWDMKKDGLIALDRFLSKFTTNLGKTFTFSAIWAGDPVEKKKTVSREEFRQIVKDGKIGTRTEYKVLVG